MAALSKGSDQTLYLVDGSSYFYRAYHAIGHLSNSKGQPTNAIYGFTTMLLKVLNDFQPKYLVMAFDTAEPTFREEIRADYKANREEMPDDLSLQIPYIKNVVEAFDLYSVEMPGFEADDIIATFTEAAQKQNIPVCIISGDKDLMQLVNKNVHMLDTMKNKRYGPKEVEERFGVPPDKVIEILGLAGDASDNIPGVPGIGAKTASSLIQEYGSIEKVLKNIDQIKGKKRKEMLMQYGNQALECRLMATVRRDLKIPFKLKNIQVNGLNAKKLEPLFNELEFYSLLKDLAPRTGLSQNKYTCIQTKKDFSNFIDQLKTWKEFAFDTESTSVNAMVADLVGFSFSAKKGESFYIPLGHTSGNQLMQADILNELKPVLENPNIKKIGQNIKYDMLLLKRYGIEVKGRIFDTMLASYVLTPERRQHNMDMLSQEYLNHSTITYKDVSKKLKKGENFSHIPIEDAYSYACEDADVTYRLKIILSKKLKEAQLESLFNEIEVPLVEVLLQMEMNGVLLDTHLLAKLSTKMHKELITLERKIYKLAGEEFNINSPKQLGQILFEVLELPVQKKTKTGYSTNVRVLETLSSMHDLPNEILRYRSLNKLISTYIDTLPKLVNGTTNRIHTSFNQSVAATGRLSSSNPNLQNIPIRTQEGRKIREAFIPQKEWIMLGADYSQIELRLLAHLSNDKELLQAFTENQDIHAKTAAQVFSVKIEEVDDEMRRKAKAINFGIIYGMGAFGLSNQLKINIADARFYIEQYFKTYSGVKKYIDTSLKKAHKIGSVCTLLGRRRALPDLKSSNAMARQAAERIAINTPLQGTAADLIKIAMIQLHTKMQKKKMLSRMLLQVHDELIFEAPEHELEELKVMVSKEMSQAIQLKVPLVVNINCGAHWGELH